MIYRKLNVHFAEFEDYDDNQNCRALHSVKNSPTRKVEVRTLSDAHCSPKVYKDTIIKEISSNSTRKDEAYRNVSSTACDNCRLSGLCLHGRYLERVLPKTEGMRAGVYILHLLITICDQDTFAIRQVKTRI